MLLRVHRRETLIFAAQYTVWRSAECLSLVAQTLDLVT